MRAGIDALSQSAQASSTAAGSGAEGGITFEMAAAAAGANSGKAQPSGSSVTIAAPAPKARGSKDLQRQNSGTSGKLVGFNMHLRGFREQGKVEFDVKERKQSPPPPILLPQEKESMRRNFALLDKILNNRKLKNSYLSSKAL